MKGRKNTIGSDLRVTGALLLLLIVLLLGAGLRGGKVLLPLDIVMQSWPPWQEPNRPIVVHNFALTDVVDYIIPVKRFMAEAIRRGEVPLWNPYTMAGYPFIYNTQGGLFYPFSLLYYLFPWPFAVNTTIVGQLWLGGLFMALYLRRWVRSPWAIWLGVVLFCFNGHMIVWLEWQVVHAAIIWLPLQLYFADQLVCIWYRHLPDKGRLRRKIAYLALAFAVPWLGGHWNWTLYNALLLGLYLFWRVMTEETGHGRGFGRLIRALPLLITPFLLGAGLAAIQLLPSFQYLSQSHRSNINFSALLSHGLLDRAVVLLVPNFFGNAVAQNWWGTPFSNDVETTFYASVSGLLLALLALVLRRDNITRFFGAWGILTFLWTLGTPAYGLLYLIPLFRGLSPNRASFMVAFSLAVLAPLALDALLERPEPATHHRARRWAWGFALLFVVIVAIYSFLFRDGLWAHAPFVTRQIALFALFLLLALGVLSLGRSQSHPWQIAPLFLGLVITELFLFGYGYNTVSSVADFYPSQEIERFLAREKEPFRIVTSAEGIVYRPNTALIPHIPNLSGYEPGLPRRLINYLELAEGESVIRHGRFMLPLKGLSSPLLDALNVKYLPTVYDLWGDQALLGVAQEGVEAWQVLPQRTALTLPDAGLFRVEVPLIVSPSADGIVTARIFSADESYEFAHASLPIGDMADQSWVSFDFSPFPSEWGRNFTLQLHYEGTGEVQAGRDLAGANAYRAYYLPRPNLVYEDKKTRLYLNEGAMPRVYAVSSAIIAPDESTTLALLKDEPSRVYREVILEMEGQPPPPLKPTTDSPQFSVQITDYALNRVTVHAEMPAEGMVVLADMMYAGWQARVDDQAVPLYRANSVVRAVYVPQGHHEIEFVFRPNSFFVGLTLTLITLTLILSFCFWPKPKLR